MNVVFSQLPLSENRRGYVEEGSAYDEAAEAGLSPEIAWGGQWVGFVDKPHYQAPGLPGAARNRPGRVRRALARDSTPVNIHIAGGGAAE